METYTISAEAMSDNQPVDVTVLYRRGRWIVHRDADLGTYAVTFAPLGGPTWHDCPAGSTAGHRFTNRRVAERLVRLFATNDDTATKPTEGWAGSVGRSLGTWMRETKPWYAETDTAWTARAARWIYRATMDPSVITGERRATGSADDPIGVYSEKANRSEGYCTECRDWTRGTTEPDAEGYECPSCGGNTVIGADVALISGAVG